MAIKRSAGSIVTACILVFLLISCGGNVSQSDNIVPADTYANKPPLIERTVTDAFDYTDIYELVAGDDEVGYCKVVFGLRTLTVELFAYESWELENARIYALDTLPEGDIEYNSPRVIIAGDTPPLPADTDLESTITVSPYVSIPTNIFAGSDSQLLNLPYEDPSIGDTHKLLKFKLPAYSPGTTVYLKVDADVTRDGEVVNAGMCIDDVPEDLIHEYTVQAGLLLPEDPVICKVSQGSTSNFATKPLNIPTGFDIDNETYLGWCVDRTRYIFFENVEVTLYNSLDPNIPEDVCDEDWHKVNYIINHKQGTVADIQNAIWHFIGGGEHDLTDATQSMIDDANTYGADYMPGDPTEHILVIVYPSSDDTQRTVIEIPWEKYLNGAI